MDITKMREAGMLEVGYATRIPEAKKLALELVKRSVELYEKLEAKDEAGHEFSGKETKYDWVDGEFKLISEDTTMSDPIIKALGQIESIAYRLRIDAGIWPSDVDFKEEHVHG